MRLSKKIAILSEQGIFSAASFFINIALAAQVGIYQYGLFASLTIALYLLLGISQSLIIQPMQTYLAKCADHFSYKTFLLASVLVLTTTMTGICYLINTVAYDLLVNYQDYLASFSLYVFLFIVFDFFRKYFLAVEKVILSLIITGLYAFTLAIVSVYAYFNNISELSNLFPFAVLSYIPSIILSLFFYFKGKGSLNNSFVKSALKYHTKEGKWLLYASLVQWSSSNIFYLSSGVLVGLEALGILKYFQTLFGVINIALQGIENFVLPKLSRAYSISIEACYSEFQKLFGGFLLIIISGLIAIALFSNPILTVIGGEDFSKYHLVLSAMSVLYLIIIIGYPLRLIIRILDLNKFYFVAYLLSFVCSLLTYQLLLQHFGIVGAVLGLISNQLILQSVWLYILNKKQFKIWKLYIS